MAGSVPPQRPRSSRWKLIFLAFVLTALILGFGYAMVVVI